MWLNSEHVIQIMGGLLFTVTLGWTSTWGNEIKLLLHKLDELDIC